MACILEISLSKKLPIPGAEFSSKSASISLNAEIIDPSLILSESKRLYDLAERAIDQQLGIIVPAQNPSTSQQQGPSQPRSAPRRGPAPITDSQLKYLNRLISQGNHSLSAILHDFQIGSLGDLTCKDGADLISRLKAGVA